MHSRKIIARISEGSDTIEDIDPIAEAAAHFMGGSITFVERTCRRESRRRRRRLFEYSAEGYLAALALDLSTIGNVNMKLMILTSPKGKCRTIRMVYGGAIPEQGKATVDDQQRSLTTLFARQPPWNRP